ncbi:hypothetical protein LZD49_32450 [Dyadobacter sp. CY261]|uniref:hypothetical protein n=1 Tax=Dyadobacter sp. CY261 TaxID=2907203 RepID=UPI001F362DF4|nr:hypothetical protein [Dyadobacter sp. CY261]MCF0075239.1 hypothetical protein [Dyadobacter sp. CY261]
MNSRRLAMEYQEHLLKSVFKGNKERFEKAWQQALDEGCEGAVSWNKLVTPATLSEKPLDLTSIYKSESLPYGLKQLSFKPFQSFFIWKR